jgi:hypothetical protein
MQDPFSRCFLTHLWGIALWHVLQWLQYQQITKRAMKRAVSTLNSILCLVLKQPRVSKME